MANQQPQEFQQQLQQYQTCIDACLACARACEMCASACLREQNVAELARCIRMNQDCATICFAAAALMVRGGDHAQQLCRLCAEVCDACGAECEKYQLAHCQTCAQACRSCADECRAMAGGSKQKAA